MAVKKNIIKVKKKSGGKNKKWVEKKNGVKIKSKLKKKMGVKKNLGKSVVDKKKCHQNSYQLPVTVTVTITVTVTVVDITIIIIPTNNFLVGKKIIKKVEKKEW